MADWIIGYQKGVQDGKRGLTAAEWQHYESEVTERPHPDLKALYAAFNGGELEGGVRLYAFDKVVDAREHSEDSTWVFGEKGNQRLLSSRKATLASHPGLTLRPTWFETTDADQLVFGVHDARAGSLRVYPSLEQLLAVLVPPAQLEAFGDHTYARAMAAVESVISGVSTKAKSAVKKVTKLATGAGKAAAKAKKAAKETAKSAKKGAVPKSAAKKGAGAKSVAKKGAGAKSAAKKGAGAKSVAKKGAGAKSAAKKSAGGKSGVKKGAGGKSGAKKSADVKPAAKKGAGVKRGATKSSRDTRRR